MIPEREVKEIAREHGVPVSTVERDYAQNWLLKFIGSSFMALKGGTGIRKAYIKNYRFSDDLDFTLLEKINFENAWKKSLSHQIKDLPYFDSVYKEVLKKLSLYSEVS